MSEYRKTYQGGLFFITLTVVGWIDVFTRKEYADIIVENLEFCQKEKDLAIFAYVIMPSHIHLIVRRNEGLLSDWLRDFKSYTAKQIIKEIENGGFESRKEWFLHLFKYYAKFQAQNSKYMFWQNQIILLIYLQKSNISNYLVFRFFISKTKKKFPTQKNNRK